MIDGDVMPSLVHANSDLMAIIACKAINLSFLRYEWLIPWRRETQNVIPKNPSPTNLDELRNLSCMNLMSKLMESILLERLKGEITLNTNQYGGIVGSGSNHLLINMWDRILEGLSEGRTAVLLVAVDFSKAFNRMNHDECLRALAEKGASTESIKMVAAFLGKRSMRMRVGSAFSSERQVTGGTPQGTKMGFFCLQ